MKNILIVVVHPKQNSFSFAIANKYKEVSLEHHNMPIVLLSSKGL